MRSFKIAGMLFILALSISAVTAGSASAAAGFLGTFPSTIKGTSKESKLEDPATKLTIKSKKSAVTGTVTSSTAVEAVVNFEESTIGGVAAVSLGDKGGLILVKVTGVICDITGTTSGTFFSLPAEGVHIEVPSLGELLVVKGTVIGKNTPVGTLSTTGTVELPKTAIAECGGKKAGLTLEKEHNEKPLTAIEETTQSLTFGNDLTLDV